MSDESRDMDEGMTSRIDRNDLVIGEETDELAVTVEMSGVEKDAGTKPMQPVPDATTQRLEVPQELLEQSRRSREFSYVSRRSDEVTIEVVPDAEGRVRLPDVVLERLREDQPVRIRVELPSPHK